MSMMECFCKNISRLWTIAVIFCKDLQSVTVKRKLTGRKISEKFTERFGNILYGMFSAISLISREFKPNPLSNCFCAKYVIKW